MKTKTVRAKLDDAFKIEQCARELSAELQTVIKVSDLIEELTKDIENAKKRIKDKTRGTSEKGK